MKTKVHIIESESGWGQKVEDTLEYDIRYKDKLGNLKYNHVKEFELRKRNELE